MNKILRFIDDKRYFFMAIIGVILITMSFKSQAVIIQYTDDYALRMEYTIYGYCIRASASLKAAEPAVYNELYMGNSINKSILKAVNQLELLGGEGETVKIMATGFPRNNEKLEDSIKEFLESEGKNVEILIL